MNDAAGESESGASPGRATSNRALAAFRTVALLSATTFCIAGVIASVAAARAAGASRRRTYAVATWWTHLWSKLSVAACGFRVTRKGPAPPANALIAPNHLGYLDVFAVGALARGFFVPKADLASWPFVRTMVRGSLQPLVERSVSRALADAVREVEDRLAEGASVCAFLEGTSTGGDRVLPFLPSLVQPAVATGRPIVPVGIRWSAANPAVSIADDVAYWTPEHTLGPHIWRFLGLRGIRVEVEFGDPIDPRDFPNRKALAAEARRRVEALAGCSPESA